MWQVRQKIDEKIALDVDRKNKLRYVLQNNTKKNNPDNVMKMSTKKAKKLMKDTSYLLTPNKYSTFVCVDEFYKGGSFGFLFEIIDMDYHKVVGKPFNATSLNFNNRSKSPSPDTPKKKRKNGGLHRDQSSLVILPSNQTNFYFPPYPTCLPHQQVFTTSFRHNKNHSPSLSRIIPSQPYYPPNFGSFYLPNVPQMEGSLFKSDQSAFIPFQANYFQNQQLYQQISFNSQPGPPYTNWQPVNQFQEEEDPTISNLLSLKNFPSILSAVNEISKFEGHFVDIEPNKRKNEEIEKKPIMKRVGKYVEIDIDVNNVPHKKLKQRATLHTCIIEGREFSFITCIDLKKLVPEQVDATGAALTATLQIVEKSFCFESPKFDVGTYKSHFEFPKNKCKSTRIFILFDDHNLAQRLHIKRDSVKKRWIIFVKKRYKYFEGIPYLVINDSQLTRENFNGPKDKIISLLNNLGFNIQQVQEDSKEMFHFVAIKDTEIHSLNFEREGIQISGNCFPSFPHMLTIQGKGFTVGKDVSVSISLSPSPTNYRVDGEMENIYRLNTGARVAHLISCTTLLKFLPQQREDILEMICSNSRNHRFFPGAEIDGNNAFFLVDFLHIPHHFEIRRVSKENLIWHLYIFSENTTAIIDCSNFVPNLLMQICPSLQELHDRIFKMEQSPFNKELSRVTNSPPKFATELLLQNQNFSDNQISQIPVPPLNEGLYTCWLRIYKKMVPLKCVSKQFNVSQL